ncbi:ferritin-like domain-containing protein [Bacillus pinisoli]|uniref:ferritin-like domain-containing protein n=1 Tax=Bacillus pinisoli TaxID=2901866 RepID=UPI001FF4ACBA|nr:ferritin-like domain-containing protein [Bacillus pinisoli]
MPGKDVITTLNEFLKGQYMGIHAYEHYIQRLEDPEIKRTFQHIQQEHKQHALQVAERIQNLGGTSVDNEGMFGSIQGYIGKFMIPTEQNKIIDSALKGESYYGIELSEEMVKGDLDQESKQLIESILDKDREHVSLLASLIH